MCRHKPGARCYSRAHSSHGSAIRRLQKAQEAWTQAQGNPAATFRLDGLRERLTEAVREAEHATFDLDATRTQQTKLAAAIARPSLSETTRAGLVARAAAGVALREARKEQVKAMPPLPGTSTGHDAEGLYENLGEQREQIAYLDTRLASAGERERAALQVRRDVIDADCLALEVRYRVRAADGLPDLRRLSPAERSLLGAGVSPEVAAEVAYLAHLRVVAERHPGRLDAEVAEREQRLGGLVDG